MGLTPFPSQQATIARSPLLPTAFFSMLYVSFLSVLFRNPHSSFRNPYYLGLSFCCI
jgi:hypothetical protein